MARRTLRPFWAASFKRTLKALSRAGSRAITAAAKQALRAGTSARPVKAKPARAMPLRVAVPVPVPVPLRAPLHAPKRAPTDARTRAPRPGGAWSDGVAIGAVGARRYRLCMPPRGAASPRASVPLLVLLHGCNQDAAAIARVSRAASAGFAVLCPEQDRRANPQGCWNWFEARSGRAAAEAATIVAAIADACARQPVDATRIVVAGFSAGAGMAAWLGMLYPARFAAVAMHSGVAPCTARSAAGALRAMQGRVTPPALDVTANVAAALPPLLVIQGSADGVVAARNGRLAAQWWADAAGAQAGPARVLQRGRRRAAMLTDYRAGRRLVATLCEIEGLGHAWSGGGAAQPWSDPAGPDALRMIRAFAARAFAAARAVT